MNTTDVIEFFDRLAPSWDEGLIHNDTIINKILDNVGIREGMKVLDVACGTGVLFPDYLARRVGSLTAIDIAPEMAKRAQEKFPKVKVLCGDVETHDFGHPFDAVVIYNAFPHFPDPARLIRRIAALLPEGGRFTVAHGMSREKLISHHSGTASKVSIPLLELPELVALFEPWFEVTTAISDDTMYQVVGIRKPQAK